MKSEHQSGDISSPLSSYFSQGTKGEKGSERKDKTV